MVDLIHDALIRRLGAGIERMQILEYKFVEALWKQLLG